MYCEEGRVDGELGIYRDMNMESVEVSGVDIGIVDDVEEFQVYDKEKEGRKERGRKKYQGKK